MNYVFGRMDLHVHSKQLVKGKQKQENTNSVIVQRLFPPFNIMIGVIPVPVPSNFNTDIFNRIWTSEYIVDKTEHNVFILCLKEELKKFCFVNAVVTVEPYYSEATTSHQGFFA